METMAEELVRFFTGNNVIRWIYMQCMHFVSVEIKIEKNTFSHPYIPTLVGTEMFHEIIVKL